LAALSAPVSLGLFYTQNGELRPIPKPLIAASLFFSTSSSTVLSPPRIKNVNPSQDQTPAPNGDSYEKLIIYQRASLASEKIKSIRNLLTAGKSRFGENTRINNKILFFKY
jgi:hypothetical protein